MPIASAIRGVAKVRNFTHSFDLKYLEPSAYFHNDKVNLLLICMACLKEVIAHLLMKYPAYVETGVPVPRSQPHKSGRCSERVEARSYRHTV
jgi:hypothetical protein